LLLELECLMKLCLNATNVVVDSFRIETYGVCVDRLTGGRCATVRFSDNHPVQDGEESTE
jgi:DNA gyrase inhibitor GyrI